MMLDITKCDNEECTKKEECWRYTAPPEKLQSYAHFNPENKEKCEYFWKNT